MVKNFKNKRVLLTEKKFKTIKNGLIITGTTTGIKPPKVSLNAIGIIKLAGGICRGVLVKDFAVYKKCINESVVVLWVGMNNIIAWSRLLPLRKITAR